MFRKTIEHAATRLLDALLSQEQGRYIKQRLGIKVHDTARATYPTNRYVQQDGFIHVFTDGSCNYRQEKLGAGIVIATTDNKTRICFARKVVAEEGFDLRRFGAMKAEFRAATDALNILPDNTNVHIYTDHPILRSVLRRHISGKDILPPPRTQESHDPEFIQMVGDLKEALTRKMDIEVTNLKDTQSRRMLSAHKLAAIGSGAKGIKVRKSDKADRTKTHQAENPFFAGDPRYSDDTDSDPITSFGPMGVIKRNP